MQDEAGSVRVIVTADKPIEASLNKFGSTLEVRLVTKELVRFRSEPIHSRLVHSFGWASTKQGYVLSVDCLTADFQYETLRSTPPRRLEIVLKPVAQEARLTKQEIPATAAGSSETKSTVHIETINKIGEREGKKEGEQISASRRVKTIVIDPGHGGVETGARGPAGTLEKDITLAIALQLKEIIERHLALRVVLTRDKDVDVSLENRAAVANNNRADLFLSIHANGAFRAKANGSETYFLSLKASDEEARRLAYLENNSPEFEQKIEEESQDQIKMILWDMAQAAFLQQSSQLAEFIQKELNLLLGTANRGIKQAPFKVLTGVACPAVLVEVAFISNPDEEAKLRDETFQASVALAIYQGLLSYLRQL